ncbi:MAG TPA: hypothetical protein VKB86_15105 [Pyrinomonadaceae bacterium]|nr:hypothetical protein [Pyrinomonadaceae bacterium]
MRKAYKYQLLADRIVHPFHQGQKPELKNEGNQGPGAIGPEENPSPVIRKKPPEAIEEKHYQAES